ncbi:metabolite-proton symporter [Saccharopolyspora erythraea NRRL 2338]|uniref:MFS transporter n=2 Tax=Saccharopolyspora erythraea TaxID=1836 RepID=A0ABP3MS20_SACER|nr:MFS transporter [Saccharopolyspora erythraea]EQD84768.1 MFS transporter [Saccharopolyspora erythraea D]PFG99492.1 metabolite-proton symporter [Saccharopolyspora erythraea NRRL 2338]QRK89396.1 MHS family MFS transporter [Saccharopolyspora erythraea]CAM05850.1 metabolite transporter, MFS superfamily [Saccharopolyspora erythraea NRRL 2338]
MSTGSANVPTRSATSRVVGASLVGTTVEWYDFFLYGSAAALVFNKLFFPAGDPLIGTMLAFITYAVGFVARPLGGLVFGHYGDRLGRKKLLVLSLVLMGGATFLIGLLPTFQTIGLAAPLLLTLLRLIQGFAIGGEWGGAVLIVSEHGSAKHRGFWASWPQAGVPLGNLLGTAVLAVLAAVQSDEAFLAWGWRIAFLLSGVLVLIGLWVRLAVAESPLFVEAARKAAEEGTEQHAPIMEVLSRYKREVLIAMGARFAENVVYYVLTSFVLTYVATFLELPRSVALNASLIAAIVHFLSIPLWGALSDRVGRRPVYLVGAVGTGLWAFVFFTMLDTKSFFVITFATTVGLVFHGAMYGPQAAYFAELFGTRVRYSGASIGYQLASIVAGSLAPIIATALLAAFGSSLPISIYVALCSVITIIAVVVSPETRTRDLAADHAV